MQNKILLALLIMLVLIMTGCVSQKYSKKSDDGLPASLQEYKEDISSKEIPKDLLSTDKIHKVDLKIDGMICPSCALGVEYQLKQLSGVYDARVNYPAGTAFVIYDVTKLSTESIAKASTTYPTKVIKDVVYNRGLENEN